MCSSRPPSFCQGQDLRFTAARVGHIARGMHVPNRAKASLSCHSGAQKNTSPHLVFVLSRRREQPFRHFGPLQNGKNGEARDKTLMDQRGNHRFNKLPFACLANIPRPVFLALLLPMRRILAEAKRWRNRAHTIVRSAHSTLGIDS